MGRKRKKHRKQKIEEKTLEAKAMISHLYIKKEVYDKVMHWVNLADTEVSGLGTIEIVNGIPWVTDAILLEQECTSVETELDAASIGKALYEHLAQKKPGQLRWWWHSHVNMSVFWSGTDNATIQSLGKNGWIIATVFNKKYEQRTAYYSQTPFQVFLDNIETNFVSPLNASAEKWSEEFKAKVKPKSYAYSGHYDSGYQSNRSHWDDKTRTWSDWKPSATEELASVSKLTDADIQAMEQLEILEKKDKQESNDDRKADLIARMRRLSYTESDIDESMRHFDLDSIDRMLESDEEEMSYGYSGVV